MNLHRRQGFTLIELLVVIAIIAILAAIIFPVFASAMERSRMATCQSNLKQIGVAFAMYLDDYDGTYPCANPCFVSITSSYGIGLWSGRWWRWPLKPYLALSAKQADANDVRYSTGNRNNVLLCPGDLTNPVAYDSTSYCYSMSFYVSPAEINTLTKEDTYKKAPTPCPQSEASVAYPAQKIIVAEWTSNHESPKTATLWSWDGGHACLFADGHVKYLKAKQILPANDNLPDINLTRDGILGKDIQ